MKLRGVPVAALVEAGALLVVRRLFTRRVRIQGLLKPSPGRAALSKDELTLALGAEAGLRRLGVSCLWRAVVVTEMLRRRGVAARVRLSVLSQEPGRAHAEVEVGGEPLRQEPEGSVVLRWGGASGSSTHQR
jgi:Transglutaminase-like superfamily